MIKLLNGDTCSGVDQGEEGGEEGVIEGGNCPSSPPPITKNNGTKLQE